jgi:hypothetical protein
MSKDMLEKLKRLGGAKVTTAETLGIKPAKTAAPKVAESSWADDVVDEEEEEVDEEEVGYSVDDEVDSAEDYEDEDGDSDIPDTTHREPATAVSVPDYDAFAKKVADLLFAKIRDAFNSVP